MDAVEDVKSRLAIEDVVGEYLELKRAGRNYKALSPFTSEKTPSFMVSPDKGIWHDFSSGKGGNIFSFVMEMEGLDFKGALELLARKAGVDLSQYRTGSSSNNTKRRNRLFDLLEASTKFYQVHFSKNKTALEYILKKRGYSKKTALDFRIGYSPTSDTALVDFLKKRGYSEREIKDAGLSTVRRGQVQDMFRGRIMIPLSDAQGRVVGFTARILQDDPNAPKYINTPATMLYDKGRQVFGLHLAKEAMRKQNFVVVVEGNLDVIASHQAGVTNVVATAGTAMTTMHLKELSRFTHDIRLSFDQDNAGLTATERAISLAGGLDISLSIISVPTGKDPDELIKQDVQAWKDVVSKPQYALDWLIDRYQAQYDISTAPGKKALVAKITPVISGLQNKVEKEHYIKKVAGLLNVSESALDVQAAQKQAPKRRVKEIQQVTRSEADVIKTQNQLLSLCLFEKSLREYIQHIEPVMITGEESKKVLEFLRTNPDVTVKTDAPLPKELQSVNDYVKILVLLYEELYTSLEMIELRYEAARLQARVIEQFVKSQKAFLAGAMADANEAQTTELLQKAKELDQLLHTIKRE